MDSCIACIVSKLADLVQVGSVVEQVVCRLEVKALLYLGVGTDEEVEKAQEER